MEVIERRMLITAGNNLMRCTDFPDGIDDYDDMNEDELVNWVKIIKGSIKDNVNMIRTIVDNDIEQSKTPKGSMTLG